MSYFDPAYFDATYFATSGTAGRALRGRRFLHPVEDNTKARSVPEDDEGLLMVLIL